jgi:RNA polymerase sigma-70 factor (ECF subfamily)
LERSFETSMAELYPALEQRLAVVLRDPEEARDVAQEAFLRAYQAWSRFDGADPRAWLYTIGLRLAFNELRRRRGWLRTLERARPLAEWSPAIEPDLWKAIGELDPRQRAALVLHVVDGYTQTEIGAMLDAPNGTVASWIARAKATLRGALEEA